MFDMVKYQCHGKNGNIISLYQPFLQIATELNLITFSLGILDHNYLLEIFVGNMCRCRVHSACHFSLKSTHIIIIQLALPTCINAVKINGLCKSLSWVIMHVHLRQIQIYHTAQNWCIHVEWSRWTSQLITGKSNGSSVHLSYRNRIDSVQHLLYQTPHLIQWFTWLPHAVILYEPLRSKNIVIMNSLKAAFAQFVCSNFSSCGSVDTSSSTHDGSLHLIKVAFITHNIIQFFSAVAVTVIF